MTGFSALEKKYKIYHAYQSQVLSYPLLLIEKRDFSRDLACSKKCLCAMVEQNGTLRMDRKMYRDNFLVNDAVY